MKEFKNVTGIVTSFNNWQFTMATLASINRYYNMRVIIADGGSKWKEIKELQSNIRRLKNLQIEFMFGPGLLTEECRNKASKRVNTEFILFFDNDVKVINNNAIDILLDTFSNNDKVAQSAAYGIKVYDLEKRISFVGTEFTEYFEVDSMPCYFSLNKTEAYREVNGQPLRWLYPTFDTAGNPLESTNGGDLSIGLEYQKYGWKNVTPKITVPILHWVSPMRWEYDRPIEDSFRNDCTHIRLNPFNKENYELALKNTKNVV